MEIKRADLFEDTASDEVVQAVIDSLPTLYYLVDADGWIVRWNNKSIEVSGYSAAEHKHMHLLDLFEGEDKDHIADRMGQVFEIGAASADSNLRTKDGRKIPYHFSGKLIHVGGLPYLSGLGIDISEQKQLEKQLTEQATTDGLTGVSNRRHFLQLAEREITLARHYGHPLTLLMLDLDHFKSINDKHGHKAGDDVLREVIQICRRVIRDSDCIGRLGGEEFAILLPRTDRDGAYQLAERLRRQIAESSIALAHDAGELTFTTSIGMAPMSRDWGIDKLLAIADDALYAAKAAGRNCVKVADPGAD